MNDFGIMKSDLREFAKSGAPLACMEKKQEPNAKEIRADHN